MSGEDEDRLFGLMEIAHGHQAAVQAALAGLAAERVALQRERETLAHQVRSLAHSTDAAVRSAVTASLVGAATDGAAAVQAATQPLLGRLAGVTQNAERAEAALRKVVLWASWRLLGRGLAVAAMLGTAPWLADLSVWWWAERDLRLLQTQRALVEADIAGLQGQRTELAAGLGALEKAGGLAKLTRCGPAPGRLCIRVEDGAGVFANGLGSYRVIQGY